MNARAPVMAFSAGLLLCVVLGCGTPGVPQPPSLDVPKPVEDLRASRQGNVVSLAWTAPNETTDQTTIRHPGPTLVCRVLGQAPMEQCHAVLQLPPQPRELSKGAGKPISRLTNEKDVLPDGILAAGSYATYAIEAQNNRERSAGLSNQVMVPLAPVSHPLKLSYIKTFPDAIEFSGEIALTASPSTKERFVIRRREKDSDAVMVVAELPRTVSEVGGQIASFPFRDESFDWEKSYEYQLAVVATELSPSGQGLEFESDPTPAVSVTTRDIFPPASPTGVQAVYSGTLPGAGHFIDLTWNANHERDLAGYNVYRREEEGPTAGGMKINSGLLITPSFRDTKIEKGKRYFYSISAVDLRNNESQRSAETSEFVAK